MSRKTWSKEDIQLLRNMKESGCSLEDMILELNRSKNSIECKLRKEFHVKREDEPENIRKIWKKEELQELSRLVDEGYTLDQLISHFKRSRYAIEVKVNRIGKQLQRPRRNWLDREDEEFAEDWQDGSLSLNKLISKYNRPWFSLRKRAQILNLGPRPYNIEYVSVQDICKEMQVSHDRVYNWFKLGLKRRKNRSGKTKYVVDTKDLLEFLKDHQDHFQADKISQYLFIDEPQWLIDKRRKDREINISRRRREWTNEEDKRLVREFKAGKSDEDIAKILNRTVGGVYDHRHIIGLNRGEYTEEEIQILKDNSRHMTVEEISKLLKKRTVHSVEYMCSKLKIPYHYSKARCETRERQDNKNDRQ